MNEKIRNTLKKIDDFETKYVLLSGNVVEIMEEEKLTQTEAKEVIRILKEEGMAFNRGDVGFLQSRIKHMNFIR